MKKSLADTHPGLRSKEMRQDILCREVVSSSKVEGISCAGRVLSKCHRSETSAGVRAVPMSRVQKSVHKPKV